jgi:hypothetical protein
MRDCTRVAQRLGVLPRPRRAGVVRRGRPTAREVEVLVVLARAASTGQIGRRLGNMRATTLNGSTCRGVAPAGVMLPNPTNAGGDRLPGKSTS